ncbi:hypothetical protein Xenpb_02323 [Xenorhabdus sp. PB62.4]|nr:hypothetical protein [Xenorhabdus sp. PB62.4]
MRELNIQTICAETSSAIYDRLSEIDQRAIVDNNRSQSIPAGDGSSRKRKKPTEKKSQRSLNNDDMLEALVTLQSRSEEIFGRKIQEPCHGS